MRRFLARFANLFRRRSAEREMAREIESHLALLREDFERRGLSPEEAALAARRAYGGVEQSKELHRDARSFLWIEQLVKDVHYGWHNLLRNPGFTLVAVIALTLGIGANATIYGIYNAAALKPFPVADPGRVVRLKRWFAHKRGDAQYYFSYPEYQYLRDRSTVFSALVAADDGADDGGISVLATAPGSAAREQLGGGHAVSANYFAGLGVKALLGRTLLPDEDRSPGANPVVAIAYRLWDRRFHRDPNVIGQTLKLNGMPYTIVGIAPRKFTGTDHDLGQPDFWAPLSMREQLDLAGRPGRSDQTQTSPPFLHLLARLKEGVSRGRAQAETSLLMRQYLSGRRDPDPTTAVTLQRTSYIDYAGDLGQSAQFQAFAAGI